MSTLAEIEAAAAKLPPPQREKLRVFLASLSSGGNSPPQKKRRGLKAASYPALDGLPTDLSVVTREQVRALVIKRHAADR